jgi:hypothetical protein
MLRFLTLAFALLILDATNGEAAGVSVLFVGNSLTQANDLPGVFKRFAAESSLHADVEVRSLTPGGATFYDHWKRGEAAARLRERSPNILILQGQSVEPVLAPQNFSYYAGLLKAEADRVGAKTVLFSTWARPAGDPYYNDRTSGGSPAVMQTRLNSAYTLLAQNTGARLAPVGLAWEHAQQIAPEIKLLDGTQHPSAAGTFLAAAVLFRVVFNSSASISSCDGGLPKETSSTLRHIADDIPLAANQ